jgi:hypothetical protein
MLSMVGNFYAIGSGNVVVYSWLDRLRFDFSFFLAAALGSEFRL